MSKPKPTVYVALDYNTHQENLSFAKKLVEGVQSDDYGFKVNLDGVVTLGQNDMTAYALIKELHDMGKNTFVDFKMWNGGRTMSNNAQRAADLGVHIINMYPHAGKKFMGQVLNAVEGSDTQLFGLTVLTHYTNEDTQALYGKDVSDTVRMFAEMNQQYGAHGIILPGTMLDRVSDMSIAKLTPGVRPAWYADQKANSQEQIITPTDAIKGGARYLVVGSPVRKNPDQVEALEKVLAEVARTRN